MKRRTKAGLLTLSALIAVAILYLFWGPLFPWGSLKRGYSRIDSPKATVFISDMGGSGSVAYHMDRMMSEEEEFLGREEFLTLYRDDRSRFTGLNEGNPLSMPSRDLRLNYTYYRVFVEYLAETRGIEKMRDYLGRYIQDPDRYRELFPEVCSIDLEEIIREFRSTLDARGP